jgi:diguanylate cyclase (GGDEF)-like protein
MVNLLEHLCELGYMRRIERVEKDGRIHLKYRDLISLDTFSLLVSASGQDETPVPVSQIGRTDHRQVAEPLEARVRTEFERRFHLSVPRTILDVVAASSRRIDLAGPFSYLYELLRETIGYDRIALFLSSNLLNSQANTLSELEGIAQWAEEEQFCPKRVKQDVEDSARLLVVADLSKDARFARDVPKGAYGSIIVAPLTAEAYVYGTLEVWSREANVFSDDDAALVEFVGEFAGGLIKRRLEIEELIFMDQTAQIHNRRYFDEQLNREMERTKRSGDAMALLMIDLDDFKLVNDSCGHAAGDSVLRQVGHVLTESARQVDIVARYGGEEFAVILPGVTRETANTVAERIRGNVARHAFVTGSTDAVCDGVGRVTVSIGGALYPTDARSKSELMDKADRICLYDAKKQGKNRVIFWEEAQ